jgi:phosphatidylglycerophosphatase A
MKYFILFFATGIGIGYSPVAPGTLGSLLSIFIYYFFLSSINSYIYGFLLIVFVFFSIAISEKAQKYFGKKDDQRIVLDEIVGLLFSFLFLEGKLNLILIGFILFRFFDILKPFPIRRLEKLFKGGYGIVLDDVVAGIYTNIILQIIFYKIFH